MTAPDTPDTQTPAADPVTASTPCDGCGTPIACRWLLAAHYCGHCLAVRARAHQLVAWQATASDPFRFVTADPIGALTDLHTARAAINELIRSTAGHAAAGGASWEAIGDALHLTASQAHARYRHP